MKNLPEKFLSAYNPKDTEEKIMEFVKLWRTHFIETMKPKYMPQGWSINFRIKTKL